MTYRLSTKSSLSIKVKIKNASWRFVNRTIFRYSGRFNAFRIAILRLYGANISRSARIANSARIELPWNLTIGENSSLGPKTYLLCLDSVCIGEDTCVSDEVALLAGSHDITSPHFRLVTKKLTIGTGVWLAYRSVVLPGTNIGNFAVIGACSVIRGSIESHSIVVGNPMVVVGVREIEEHAYS